VQDFVFKMASEDWEIEEIHKFNYETFVEEIPQHSRDSSHRLVDKFHEQNSYVICLSGKQLLGMLALRGERPFSLDSKLENIDAYLPQGRSICEIRLLAVRKDRRNSSIFYGLIKMVGDYFSKHGYDVGVISGTVRQEKLYRHMGFVPFGPLVGTPGALYQPMYLTMETFLSSVAKLDKSATARDAGEMAARKRVEPGHGCAWAEGRQDRGVVNLLPGPVNVHPDVMSAFRAVPISHRSDRFIENVKETKRMLCKLTGAKYAEFFQGSGTLANDVVATELSLLSQPGLILSNGEFGERLVDHASRCSLDFGVIRKDWGDVFDYSLVGQYLERHQDTGWIWFVHCETSTGVLNDLEQISRICLERRVRICVDAISSIGTVPVPLQDVYLASCVSGKGLSALPGMAIVFHNHIIPSGSRKVPRYLDLAHYSAMEGVPFTFSSNLLHAFQAALRRLEPVRRFESVRVLSSRLRDEVRNLGYKILVPDDCSSPAVTTLVFPRHLDSRQTGLQLEQRGCLLSYNSQYLSERNWMQVCLMGECLQDDLEWALVQLNEVTGQKAG